MFRRMVITAFVCFGLLLLTLFVATSNSNSKQYVSDVFILMQPLTNSVLEPGFERQMKMAVPGISKLYFQESRFVMRGRDGKSTTNTQVVIQVAVTGEPLAATIEKANQIAPVVCAQLRRSFPNATINVLNPAVGARERTEHNWLSLRLGQRRAFEPTPISGTVGFVSTGILLAPGDTWEQHYSMGMPCPPALVGRGKLNGHFLSAHLIKSNFSDFRTAVETFKANRSKLSKIDSFQEDTFTCESGLFVVRISYTQNDNGGGRVSRSRFCEYFTTNAVGQFVWVTHLAVPADQTNEVHREILESLRLK